jgi:hypothetical protein
MSPHDWFILIAAAAFLLIGIAISPLAWLAMRQQKSQHQAATDRRLNVLEARVNQLETQAGPARQRAGEVRGEVDHKHWGASPPADTIPPMGAASDLRGRTVSDRGRARLGAEYRQQPPLAHFSQLQNRELDPPPTLIAIPKLSPALPDTDTNLESLADRYASIWDLADSGSRPDAIARATGLPVGQVELILGLRRQRTAILHAGKTHRPHS